MAGRTSQQAHREGPRSPATGDQYCRPGGLTDPPAQTGRLSGQAGMITKVARMGLLDSKVVLISGGTQGLGAGVARAAAGQGAQVMVAGRNAVAGGQVAADLRAGGAHAAF